MATVDTYYELFVKDQSKEPSILEDATLNLTGKDLDTLKSRIEGRKRKDGKKTAKSDAGMSSFVDISEEEKPADDIKQAAVDTFWAELEKMDPVSLVSDDVLDAFKYVGFDPNVVLKEILSRGKKAGKDLEAIKKDMVDMVTVAIIKGSVTEKNLKKTTDGGKVMYEALKKSYNLVTGGTKGKDSTYLTVARVAAAVPGIVTQILIKKPEYAKTFIGPFGSKSLPPYLRHQASAACVPETISEKLKDYLIGLITAYTADQSKTLSASKDTPEELFDKQLNFVTTTHGSRFPSEAHRKKIFNGFSLSSDFSKLTVVGARIKKIKPDFQNITQQELDEEIAKL